MKVLLAALGLLVLLVAGCRTVNEGSVAQSFNFSFQDQIPVPPCAQGESVSFMLEPISPLPSAQIPSSWPPSLTGEGIKAPSVSNNIRFDVCLDESSGEPEVKLQSIVPMNGFYSRGTLKPEANAEIVGFDKAIYAQDYSQLKMKIPFVTTKYPSNGPLGNVEPSDVALLVQGVKTATDQFAMVAIMNLVSSNQGNGPPSGPKKPRLVTGVLVGHLVVGNPDLMKACKDGGLETPFDFTRGTARFTGILCQYMGTSGGRPYDYAKMEITDTNPALPTGVRGIPQVFDSKEKISQIVTQSIPHHNICEATRVKLATAVYAWRMFSGNGGFEGSCPPDTAIPEAPSGNASNFADEIAWSVKYGDGTVKKGVGGGHPLNSSENVGL